MTSASSGALLSNYVAGAFRPGTAGEAIAARQEEVAQAVCPWRRERGTSSSLGDTRDSAGTSCPTSATRRSAHGLSRDSVALNLQPRVTGQVMIGSYRQSTGWDPGIDRPVLRRMVARALDFVASLAGLDIIRIWTGFRPAIPHKFPPIGPWPDESGPWILTRHEGLGIATALGTARILADLIPGRRPALDPTPFLAARA